MKGGVFAVSSPPRGNRALGPVGTTPLPGSQPSRRPPPSEIEPLQVAGTASLRSTHGMALAPHAPEARECLSDIPLQREEHYEWRQESCGGALALGSGACAGRLRN